MRQATDASRAECYLPNKPLRLCPGKNTQCQNAATKRRDQIIIKVV